jgi:predicted nucleotide-binding protein (sugar kinase/HSP70/actin superfamily)
VVLERLARTRGWKARIVSPVVSLEHGLTAPGVLLSLMDAVSELGGDVGRLPAALHTAAQAQRRYEDELAKIGERTLDWARKHRVPVVAVCGSLHVIYDRVVSAGIPAILRQNGVLALPMDCVKVPQGVPPLERIAWADARRALRVALWAREQGDVFPLLVSAFGCGPASFVEQIFARLMQGHPHTALESDGHGGTAGFVTRVQSFLHGVRRHRPDGQRRPKSLSLLEPSPRRPLSDDADARLVVLSVGKGLSDVAAASYRALGFDAVAAGPNTPESFAIGKRDCSGKECLPYQLMWGAFRQAIDETPPDRRTMLVQVTGQGACRNCLFSAKDQLTLEYHGLDQRVGVRVLGTEDDVRNRFQMRFWTGTVCWDVLYLLWAYHRVHDPGGARVAAIDERYRQELRALLETPDAGGLAGMRSRRRVWKGLLDLVERAAEEYAALEPEKSSEPRTVLVTGDIYLRIDPFANDGLVSALAERGLRTLVEPVSVMVEYLSHENSAELLGLERKILDHALHRRLLSAVRRRVWGRARRWHRWLPDPDIPRMLERARPLIDGTPFGEAPITVGSVLDAWCERRCDGVVLVSPWGCGPALVSESLLRPERDIPMLFVYNDGTPIDPRRLNAFAHRVKRRPPRAAQEASA